MEEDNIEIETTDSDGEFQFETDHLALRGNKDYCELLKYIVKLEAQKAKTLKDIEDLAEQKNKALGDPLQFVQDLKAGTLVFPKKQTISDLPQIDWNKYGIDNFMEGEDIKPNPSEFSDIENGIMVRGRKFTDSKPETFNQLWSCEEQKRLQELLEIYPEVEPQRYKKIAQALGTRTPIQVVSRVQKYFAKLAKAGLPIPGRAPKGIGKSRPNILYKKSTFFPQLRVPVMMEDPYETNESQSNILTHEFHNGNKAMIELLRSAKEQRILDEKHPIWQTNTMCVGCHKMGFLGARWTNYAGTDYCTDCIVRLLPEDKLIPVRKT